MSPQNKKVRSQRTLLIKLQEVMRHYSRENHEKMTYKILAERTGIPEERIKSIGSRPDYNASLDDLGKICAELKARPGDLLVVGTRRKRKNDPQGALPRRKEPGAPKKRKKARPKPKGKPETAMKQGRAKKGKKKD